jgi:hypothetical protein
VLIEHHWAVPLRDAIARAGASGSPTGSSVRWIWSRSGLMEAEEAKDLHAMEAAAVAAKQ